jgi:outer membrane immunogenic protein
MRTILGIVALLAMTSIAAAADYFGPSPFGGYSWIGPYVGAEAGYNWQHGNFVYGAEADLDISSAQATVAPFQFSSPWFGTARGRGGLAVGNVLIFGTAGLSFGDLRADSAGLTESHASVGWVAGGGVEVGFNQRWSAKAEWLYLDMMNQRYTLTGANNGLAANLIRFGVNYRF